MSSTGTSGLGRRDSAIACLPYLSHGQRILGLASVPTVRDLGHVNGMGERGRRGNAVGERQGGTASRPEATVTTGSGGVAGTHTHTRTHTH